LVVRTSNELTKVIVVFQNAEVPQSLLKNLQKLRQKYQKILKKRLYYRKNEGLCLFSYISGGAIKNFSAKAIEMRR